MMKVCAICDNCGVEAIALRARSVAQARWWFENYGWHIDPDGNAYCSTCDGSTPRWTQN